MDRGGLGAIVLKDPSDAATRAEVRTLLAALARSSRATASTASSRPTHCTSAAAFPPASFLVGLKPGLANGLEPDRPGARSTVKPSGTHGHLPDLPELRASFFLIGPGVPAARSLGIIDMRDVAPTLARRLGLALPTADGKVLLP